MMNNFKKNGNKQMPASLQLEKQRGFTLLEAMLSLMIGIIVLSGVMSVFIGMRTTSAETSGYGELQENARFAISLLSDDLLLQDFWGDYGLSISGDSLNASIPGAPAMPAAPALECQGQGTNNGTYPLTGLGVGNFRTLWGETATAAGVTNMSCISDARPNSDVIQIKRVISNPNIVPSNGFSYFTSNTDEGAIYSLPGAVPVIANSRTWQYQHHIYYVSDTTPTLMKWRLTSQMTNEPVVDGIERIYFMYGVSTVTDPTQPGYGVVNAYLSAANMTANGLWDNTTTLLLSVKVYVLARTMLADNKYTNNNTYILGDQAPYTPGDNFRRLLLSSTVTLFNAESDSWN